MKKYLKLLLALITSIIVGGLILHFSQIVENKMSFSDYVSTFADSPYRLLLGLLAWPILILYRYDPLPRWLVPCCAIAALAVMMLIYRKKILPQSPMFRIISSSILVVCILFVPIVDIIKYINTERIPVDYPASQPIPTKEQIPKNVLNAFDDVKEDSFEATLEFCRKGNEGGYEVSGTMMHSNKRAYFNAQGRLITVEITGDTIDNVPPKVPFEGFTCTQILSSKENN
jgi:hypothetical protein